MSSSKPNGVVLYRGPSLLTGEPVVCIATGVARPSLNGKTGSFIQTYILPDNGADPLANLASGGDRSVCGDCTHRPQPGPDGKRSAGSCYVNVGQAPLAVFRAHRSGGYPNFEPAKHLRLFRRRPLRLGAYGDPAAVPLSVWETVCGAAGRWTGYTHQWRNCAREYSRYCMASCDSVEDRRQALALGYRTFRVRLPEEPLEAGEFACPASQEAGYRLTGTLPHHLARI